MKTIITPAYTFTPGVSGIGTLNLNITNFSIKNLYAVLNQTQQAIIYATGTAGFGYTSKTGSTLTLSQNTSSMLSTDELMIVYDDQSGTNYSGYSGSLNFGPLSVSLAPTASSYAVGAVIGGLKTVSIFRSLVQPSATLAQIMFQWPVAVTNTPVTVLAFSRMPTSTFTDGALINGGSGLTNTDANYLIAPPQIITPMTTSVFSIPTGYTNGSWPVKNADVSVSSNIYIAVLAGAIISTTPSGAWLSISGVQD